jgi:SAM-dependent methyltransferase
VEDEEERRLEKSAKTWHWKVLAFGFLGAIRYDALGAHQYYTTLFVFRLVSRMVVMMAEKQHTLGQFDTPLNVADLLLGFCLRRPADRVLDPGCGDGFLLSRAADWLDWLAASPADGSSDAILGVELDPIVAGEAQIRLPHAQILNQNFFALDPESFRPVDAIVGNPPYTRSQWIGQLEPAKVRQMPMFQWVEETPAADKLPLISRKLAESLSGRSGLHAYFFLHSEQFLRESGRLGFVVPNGWLDVAYGTDLKQFLLDHFRILAIVESAVERWFATARVNTCLVILEKCGVLQRRTTNPIRLIRLKRPLHQLIPHEIGQRRRFLAVEQLISQLTPVRPYMTEDFAVHIVQQSKFRSGDKWGMALRAPTVYRHHRDHLDLFSLKQWASVQRGYTTGANEFFYLEEATVEQWSIEKRYRRPLLKSLRGIDRLRLDENDCRQEVLLIPPEDNIQGTAVADYIAWGEAQGYNQRQTCLAREPWYSLPHQSPAPLVLPKGIWHRHIAPLLETDLAVDQQLYQIQPSQHVPLLAAAALFNSAWFALQVELQGRVNFGKGLLWLATYELDEVRLPDPRRLVADQLLKLEQAFLCLAERPLAGSAPDLALPNRQALDEVVFDILGFSTAERTAVVESLQERLTSRRLRATHTL